jgi:lysophospholipase L1-like esterase
MDPVIGRSRAFVGLCVFFAFGCSQAASGIDSSGAGAGAVAAGGAAAGAPSGGSSTAGSSAAGTGIAGEGGASTGGAGTAGSSIGGAGAAGANVGGAAGTGGAGGSISGGAGVGGTTQDVDHSLPGVIVVLGSSTSAGTGPKDPNNAYLVRYKAYLAGAFPKFTLTNLAVGGYTTYNMQPSDYKPPAGRPAPVVGHNITTALSLKPNVIIVNMPSNDQADNFPVSEQMANYDRVATLAAAAHVQLWVTTTQPRNFTDPAQLKNLMDARDAIKQKYMPRVLDFWTPFAQADGTQMPQYGAGDGIHLNDAAHAILESIVVAAQIPETYLRALK